MMGKVIMVFVFALLGTVFPKIVNVELDLYNAVYFGTLDDVIENLALGGNPNWRNPDEGEAALHRASFTQRPDVVNVLLDAGADVNLQDDMGRTALHYASAAETYTTVVRALLDKGAYVDVHDNYGMTPMFYAKKFGDIDTVKILIDYGADINIPDSDDGLTPLMEVAYKGYVAKVKTLPDANTNVRLSANDVSTVLHLVARGALVLAEKTNQQEIGTEAGKNNNRSKSFDGPNTNAATNIQAFNLYLLTGGVVMFVISTLHIG